MRDEDVLYNDDCKQDKENDEIDFLKLVCRWKWTIERNKMNMIRV